MSFFLKILALLLLAGVGRLARGHEESGGTSLPCDSTAGEACYFALVDDFHANPSTTDATAQVHLTLNAARNAIAYEIQFDELLHLKPNPADRTEPDDILGIHLHLHVPDTIGPHLLNIFGLATPALYAEEDADLVIDYEHHRLTGNYDLSDATIDPATGEPYPQFFFATSKIMTNWLSELDHGEWVLAVHTVESGFKNFAIHGHIRPVPIPEPAGIVLTVLCGIGILARARRRSFHVAIQ
jgi:hypothetical protein